MVWGKWWTRKHAPTKKYSDSAALKLGCWNHVSTRLSMRCPSRPPLCLNTCCCELWSLDSCSHLNALCCSLTLVLEVNMSTFKCSLLQPFICICFAVSWTTGHDSVLQPSEIVPDPISKTFPNFSCFPLAEWHMNNLGAFLKNIKQNSVLKTLVCQPM